MPINITAYGATANDTTDDQSAIQAAINAAKAAGDTVYVPTGTFRHSGRLTLDGVVMYGNGNDQSVLKGTTYVKHAIDLRGDDPGLYNLTIEGTGTGPRSSDRGGNGVYILNSDGYVVQNVHVKNVSGAGIMTEFGSNGKILHNLVELTGADGIYSTEATNNLEVAYNKTIATGDDAISFTSYSNAAKVHDIDVHHNTVTGNWQSRSITVNGGDAIQIHDNHVDGGTAGISVGATTAWGSTQNSNISATNNTVRDATFTGEGTIGGGALHLYNNRGGTDTNITFTGNQVYNPADSGIYVWGTNQIDADVLNNKFYMTASHQVYENDNPGATQITESGNMRYDPSAYTGDMISASVGGIDPNFQYGQTTPPPPPPGDTPTFTTANYTGTSADETIIGNDLDNVIDGQYGNDTIKGGLGADKIIGSVGSDVMTGGAGNDRFDWNLYSQFGTSTLDKVTDFATGDRLDVYDLDANLALTGNQAFAFIGTSAFSAPGQIRYFTDATAGTTTIQGSNDADTTLEFSILLTGVRTMAAADFVL